MNKKYRTIYCGDISNNDIDKEVKVAGWIENIRDHGGVIFLDIRDEHGTVQDVSNDDTNIIVEILIPSISFLNLTVCFLFYYMCSFL